MNPLDSVWPPPPSCFQSGALSRMNDDSPPSMQHFIVNKSEMGKNLNAHKMLWIGDRPLKWIKNNHNDKKSRTGQTDAETGA